MHLSLSPQSGRPLYEQIVTQLKQQIAMGTLSPHQPLPSIRALAKDMRISVITTKRAYEELERDGFVYSLPGKGTFVAPVPDRSIREDNRRQVKESLQKAVRLARENGISQEDLGEMLSIIYQEE